MVIPLSTPGGTDTSTVFLRLAVPLPPHDVHGSLMVRPAPEQRVHVVRTSKNPFDMWTSPVPLHAGQTDGWERLALPVPSHELHVSCT